MAKRYKQVQKGTVVAVRNDNGTMKGWLKMVDNRGNWSNSEVILGKKTKFKLQSRRKKSSGGSGG